VKRHAFEPARLLLGLALLGIAPVHVMAATGRWDVPPHVLLPLLPAALLLAGVTGAATHFARRGGRRTAGAVPPYPDDVPPLEDLPLDELRRGYEGTRRAP